jgi:YtkA-like protein
MTKYYICLAAILASLACLPTVALAAASDFAFEAVKAEVRKGDNVTVAVRLVDKRTRKAVPDAVIIQTRIDMAPEGMAEMISKLTPLPSPEPGVYAFKTELSMQGGWLLSIAAKVQGEPETVTGKVTFKATK